MECVAFVTEKFCVVFWEVAVIEKYWRQFGFIRQRLKNIKGLLKIQKPLACHRVRELVVPCEVRGDLIIRQIARPKGFINHFYNL